MSSAPCLNLLAMRRLFISSGSPATGAANPLARSFCYGHQTKRRGKLRGLHPTASICPAHVHTAVVEQREAGEVPSQSFANPAEADAERFALHPSVIHWRNWSFEDEKYATTSELVAAVAQRIGSSIAGAVDPSSATAVAYWAFHSAKNVFFASQGLASILYTEAQQRLRGEGGEAAYPIPSSARARLMCETYECFRQDLDSIQEGVYKLPWDMTTYGHRQYDPLFVLTKAREFVQEANLTLNRRKAQQAEPVWMKSDMYPEYYLSTFHYQTDGWFSSKSASIYEDAMQRQALVPIHSWLRQDGRNPADLRLLEVGCGTGRFHTFIKDNYTSMPTVALDLSPFYLQAARENVEYWRRMVKREDAAPTSFIHAAAESIPLGPESCDVVVNVYMFHEMPREAQERAASEMARVLKPGGLMVLCDSIQRGDRPLLDKRITNFSRFNEPHYEDYVGADLGQMFMDAGLQPYLKTVSSATKVLSFTKCA